MRSRPRRIALTIAVALSLAACGDDDSTTAAPEAPDGAAEDADAPPGDGSSGAAADELDACTLLTADQVRSVLEPSATEPIEVAEPEPSIAGDCAIRVEDTVFGRSSTLYVKAGDRDDFELQQTMAEGEEIEIEPRPELGPDAFYARGMAGPSLWTMVGELAVGLETAGFEEKTGLAGPDQLVELLELALAGL